MNRDFADTFFRYVVAVDMRQNSVLKNKVRNTKTLIIIRNTQIDFRIAKINFPYANNLVFRQPYANACSPTNPLRYRLPVSTSPS